MTLAERPSASSEYTVLARRYRPTRFEECIGQQHVAQALRNAIESGRVAHAYLFCGSRGVGKTSMARIFAKALNCAAGPTTNPCGECESCLAITAGSDLDVLEIDGASNRGIDEIRELRQGVGYRPSRSRFKIYIIDEVHMLTKEAFNALLKTLEEPPPHVKFIFATTEAQKIPITILSRCQRYDFATVGIEQITQRLKEIVQAEGMTAEPESVDVIARRARGSMRDSQSLLDQVLAYASGELTVAKVHQLLGSAGEERIAEAVAAILDRDAARALRMVDVAVNEGVQLGEWIEQTLDYFRDVLVLALDPEGTLLSVPERMRVELLQQASQLTPERVMEMMDILAATRLRMRGSTLGRTLVEMTFVRLCRLDHFLNLATIESASPATGNEIAPLARGGPTQPAIKKNGHLTEPPLLVSPREPFSHDSRDMPPTQQVLPLTAESLDQVWKSVKSSIEDMFLGSVLLRVESVLFDPPRKVTLRFPADAGTARKQAELKREVIAQEFLRLSGSSVDIRVDASDTKATASNKPILRSQLQLREQAKRDPLVQQAEVLLNATIIGEVTVIADPPPVPVAGEKDEARMSVEESESE